MAANPYPAEVIDLLDSSTDDEDNDIQLPIMRHRPVEIDWDDDDEDAEEDEVGGMPLPMAGAFPADDQVGVAPRLPPSQERRVDGGMVIVIDDDEVFIPDEDPQPATTVNPDALLKSSTTPDSLEESTSDHAFTVEDCLRHVLEIFPDICHDHIRSLWSSFDHESDYEVLAGRARLDNIVEQLVSATSYPKQQKGKLKRKREVSVDGPLDLKKWERTDRAAVPNSAKGSIAAICKADFPAIPRNHISEKLATNTYLFQTYIALAKDVDDSEDGVRTFGKGRASKSVTTDADTIAVNCGHPELVDELAAARLQVIALRSQRAAAKAKKRAEEENLKKAIAAGETAECSACYDDLPMNRQIHCDGDSAHFTCFDCAETYIKSEVGDARCKVLCPAGCGSGFAHRQLNLLENKQLLQKLAQIQQEQDIRDAGLEDLEDCPFCDFKAIMPPIDEDFEFRCANPECEKVSCRRCKAISHIPMSCEQHAKDNKLSSRHQIEEAMTAALVRSCNKCKKQFIKESGCNKMHCTSCGSLQCYVCSATVRDYNHFDQGGPRAKNSGAQSKKCPLYDNVEERHEREVKEAEAKARAEVVENNPDVSAEDLEIKVSDAVKKAENERVQRGAIGLPGAFAGIGRVRFPERAARFFMDDEERELDEDALDGMIGMLRGPPRPPGRPAIPPAARQRDAIEARQVEEAQQQQRLRERMRQVRHARHAAGLGMGEGGQHQGPAVQNPRAVQHDDAFGAPYGNGGLQGYIPVFFGNRQQPGQAQPAQQHQQQDADPIQQWAGAGRRLGGFNGVAEMFDDVFGLNDPAPALPAQQPRAATPQNNAQAAMNANQAMPGAAPPNTPNNNPRQRRYPRFADLADDFPGLNDPYVPGAYPPRRAAPIPPPDPPQQDNQRARDLEVLRMQHEDLQGRRERRMHEHRIRQLEVQRELQRQRLNRLNELGDRLY